jgi:hypothetical protein
MDCTNHTYSPASIKQLEIMAANISGAGALIVPKLGFAFSVAVARPPGEEVFVTAPDFPVVVAVRAAVFAASAPLQYSFKY